MHTEGKKNGFIYFKNNYHLSVLRGTIQPIDYLLDLFNNLLK